MTRLQSAYRAGQSTETAWIKVISDIIDAADSQQVTLLGLLDMNAAFETVDLDILLHLPDQEGPRLCPTLTGQPHNADYHVVCHRVRSSDLSFLFFRSGRCHRNCHGTWNSNPRVCRRHPDLRQLRRLGSSTTSVGLRFGNRILDKLKSGETECSENRINLDWYLTAALQGRGRSHDGLWVISHDDGEGMGSRCLHRQGADNGGSREQYCTWLHVPTSPTSQRQAVADPRQPARTCHSLCC